MDYDFTEDLDEFEKEYMLYAKELAKQCAKDLKEILQRNLKKEIYDEYIPKFYNRTWVLYKSIDVIVNGTDILVYFNPSLNTHINNQGVDVAENLAGWLNYGWKHKAWTGKVDYYHKRDKRKGHFMEKSLKEIRKNKDYDIFNIEIVQ